MSSSEITTEMLIESLTGLAAEMKFFAGLMERSARNIVVANMRREEIEKQVSALREEARRLGEVPLTLPNPGLKDSRSCGPIQAENSFRNFGGLQT